MLSLYLNINLLLTFIVHFRNILLFQMVDMKSFRRSMQGFNLYFPFTELLNCLFLIVISIFIHSMGNLKKSKILHLKNENMLFCWAKIDRCEQGSNLRGETPLDFKSNALTTRSSTLLIKVHFSLLYPLTWKLVSFFHNYAQ